MNFNLFSRRPLTISLFSVFSLLLASCGDHLFKPVPDLPNDVFAKKLKPLLKQPDTTAIRKIGSVANNVKIAYASNGFQPIWVKENYSPNEAAAKLITELEGMKWDGLDPEKYHLTAIRRLHEKLDTTRKNSVADAIHFDTLLTHSYLAAAKDLLLGVIVPRKADSLWYHANDTAWQAPYELANAGEKYPSLNSYRSDLPTYQLLRSEYERYCSLANDTDLLGDIGAIHFLKKPDSNLVTHINRVINKELPWVEPVANDTMTNEQQLLLAYQDYVGIRTTGKPDSTTLACLKTPPDTLMCILKANMERIRWMQRAIGDTYIIVNVPLMQLFLRKDGVNVMHMRVVVGKPERQTPSLYAIMSNVVINPTWGVPPTIMKNDVVPGFQKNGKKYLAKKGLRAYDRSGKVVKVSQLNIHNLRKYYYRQAPGDDNSLGFVKFNLPNPWDIYLHDTPHRGDFVKRYRALSSGCIRLQQPREMAVYILSELEHLRFTQGRLDTMIKTHTTRYEMLKSKIPVNIAYLTAFEDTTGSHIRFVSDVYHRDDKLIALMKKNHM